MTIKKLTKPSKKKIEHYDYNDVMDFLETKYKFNSRDYAGKFSNIPDCECKNRTKKTCPHTQKHLDSTPYQNFWHWMIDMDDEIRNGCYTCLYIDELLDKEIHDLPDWVRTILGYFKAEFPETSDCMKMWVEW